MLDCLYAEGHPLFSGSNALKSIAAQGDPAAGRWRANSSRERPLDSRFEHTGKVRIGLGMQNGAQSAAKADRYRQ